MIDNKVQTALARKFTKSTVTMKRTGLPNPQAFIGIPVFAMFFGFNLKLN
jgi:hypothetical protein